MKQKKHDFVCQHFKDKHVKCSNCNEGEKVTVKERKCKFTLENPSKTHICRIRIDGCVVQDQDTRKCDYLVLVCENKAAYFVELKGCDFSRAVDQLTRTIEDFRKNYECGEARIFARAVLTRPPLPGAIKTDAKVRQLRKLVERDCKDHEGFSCGTIQLVERNKIT